jgi:hypothetical protein
VIEEKTKIIERLIIKLIRKHGTRSTFLFSQTTKLYIHLMEIRATHLSKINIDLTRIPK